MGQIWDTQRSEWTIHIYKLSAKVKADKQEERLLDNPKSFVLSVTPRNL